MAHKLVIRASFVKPDGEEHSGVEFRQSNLDDAALGWYTDKLTHMYSFLQNAAGKKEDDSDLTAHLSVEIDGVDPNPNAPPIAGVSYHALAKWEDEVAKIGDELRKIAAAHAHAKSKKQHP